MKPAIAIFAFNRPASLARLLRSLSACPEFPDAAVTVFIDGPRSPVEAEVVAETVRIAREAATADWRIVAAETNKGLRRSIHDGVSDVCARHGHAIVLEDDLVVAPAALTYFIEGLRRYEHEPRVWSICGYSYADRRLSQENRAIFLPFAHPWGWATWRRAWEQNPYEPVPVTKDVLSSPSFRQAFDLNGLWPATATLDFAQRGLLNSWYMRWRLTIFREGGLSLFPTRKYVDNLGVGVGGTHASRWNPHGFLVRPSQPTNPHAPLWPSEVAVDYEAIDRMKWSRAAVAERWIARLGRIKRRLLRVMGGQTANSTSRAHHLTPGGT